MEGIRGHYLRKALSAITSGSKLESNMQLIGVTSLVSLLAWSPSFAAGKPVAAELKSMHQSLLAVNRQGIPKWPEDEAKAFRYLTAIIMASA